MEYEAVIGLEVHAQLLTESKIFCRCSTEFGAEPNTHVCPVCLGMPGVLPVLNKRAVDYAIRMGLAVNGRINRHAVFARKNYFYPDLPKGYQISQYEEPLVEGGYIDLEDAETKRRVRLVRIHLEEDAGKSVHAEEYVGENETLVDLNRCGVPLIEIVSEPDLRSPHEAYLYLTKLRQLVRYLGICDGNMEQGSLRCDANVSVRPKGSSELGVKTELKNMNTIRGVERALEFEVKRQVQILSTGGEVTQQTLLWDEKRGVAEPMRSKEMAHDYRYFPEPDLVPLEVEASWVETIRREMPELPDARRKRFVAAFGLPEYDATVLTESRELADYYEAVVEAGANPKKASNWVMGEVLRILNSEKIEITDFRVAPAQLAELIELVGSGSISGSAGKSVLAEMAKTGKPARQVVEEQGLVQISDEEALTSVVRQVLAEHPKEVERFRQGEAKLLGFFVGQVMRATRGKANPKLVNQLLRKQLEA